MIRNSGILNINNGRTHMPAWVVKPASGSVESLGGIRSQTEKVAETGQTTA